MTRLGELRQSIVGDIGPRAVHALEDGFTTGFLAGLWVTVPPLAYALAGILGVHPKGNGPLAILGSIQTIVREEAARAQESYFAGAAAGGTLLGLSVGTALSMAAGWQIISAGVPA
jgi:hypothetical protein